MSVDPASRQLPSSSELLDLLEVLTRQRDSSLVRLNVMDSLLKLLRPERIRLYDVVRKGNAHGLVLSVWNEGARLHFSEGAVSQEMVEPVEPGALSQRIIESESGYLCGTSSGTHECCIAVRMDDEPVSLFVMEGTHAFTDEMMGIAMGIVGVYRNYLALLQDSQHDTLTRLLNRKTFDAGFALFLTSACRADWPGHADNEDRRSHQESSHWLAVIDIDHFKRVNDTFGHLYGDEVLILMADLMRASFRAFDRLYRFGGEEFVVLMRDTAFEDAKRKLECFRSAVEQKEFPQVGRVTISIGFTSVKPISMPSDALGEADEALYYAKGHGRNQVCCYGELLEQGLISKKTVHTEADFF